MVSLRVTTKASNPEILKDIRPITMLSLYGPAEGKSHTGPFRKSEEKVLQDVTNKTFLKPIKLKQGWAGFKQPMAVKPNEGGIFKFESSWEGPLLVQQPSGEVREVSLYGSGSNRPPDPPDPMGGTKSLEDFGDNHL